MSLSMPGPNVAFVGLGRMGWPMASRLAAAGFQLIVIDVDLDRAIRFGEQSGCEVAATLSEVAGSVSRVITILPSSKAVLEVVSGARGTFMEGTLLLDMSSGDPAVTRALAVELGAEGVDVLDCPVSGGVARASTGQLTVMAAGPEQAIDRAMPLLQVLGSSVHRCGGVGNGHAMKALNNLVSSAGLLVSIEALLIGQSSGLDPSRMVAVLNASSGMNFSTVHKLERFVLSGSFDSGFALDLMVKDLHIALEAARASGLPAPLSTAVEMLWASASKSLGVGSDHTAIALFEEQISGVSLVRREQC